MMFTALADFSTRQHDKTVDSLPSMIASKK
jgi:hypothetical protein